MTSLPSVICGVASFLQVSVIHLISYERNFLLLLLFRLSDINLLFKLYVHSGALSRLKLAKAAGRHEC
jgi:hypothetical protein